MALSGPYKETMVKTKQKKQQPQRVTAVLVDRPMPAKKTKKRQRRRQPREKSYAAPVALSSMQTFPNRGTLSNASWRIRNRELVMNVNGSTLFALTKISCNPGLVATFPWLAQEANRWEQYRFRSLTFRYITRTSTSTVGSVILSPEYNVRDVAPTNEQTATNTQDAVEDVPWKDIVMRLNPRAMHELGPRKLIRSAMVAGELNTYDVASVYVCTIGMTGTDQVGKLWVEYDVEFFVPQTSATDNSGSSMTSYFARSAQIDFTPSQIVLWNPDVLLPTFNPLSVTVNAGNFTLPAGCYRYIWTGCFFSAVTHNTRVVVDVLRNGASVNPPSLSTLDLVGDASEEQQIQATVTGLVVLNSTDTFAIRMVNLNATQALHVVPDTSRLIFSPA